MRADVQRTDACRLLLMLLVLCCACDVAHAEITVRDQWQQTGKVSVEGAGWSVSFAKDDAAVVLASENQVVRIVPFDDAGVPADAIVSCELAQTNSPEQAEVLVVFSAGMKRLAASFLFRREGTVRIRPAEAMRGVLVRSPIAIGVLPGIQLEDILYRAEDYPDIGEVHVSAENWFAGLLDGNDGIVACAWPDGGQRISLINGGDGAKPLFGAIKIELAGADLDLAVLAAPAIWHIEKLEPGYLERDIAIEWKRPFPATYKTQLLLRGETTIPRTFVFRKKAFNQYLPEAGECAWPVWFNGDRAFMRLSKKIPPRGEAIIYPMEDGEKTLMGFLHRTPVADIIVQRNKRAELPHGPRDAANVGFVACGGTGLMRRTIFAMGLQHREKEFLTEYADFLADYVAIVQKRHIGYFRFIDETRKKLVTWLEERGDDPEVRDYLEQMIQEADRTEESLRRKMELYGDTTPQEHIAHADRATDRLKELVDTPGTEVFPECDEIVDMCNRLSWGHAESAGMRFSMLVREWAEKAASACTDKPEALEYARTVRASIRDALNAAPPW
jgi:hypothetical protein